MTEASQHEKVTRIYEVGYVVIPTIKEEDVEKVVGTVRADIEKLDGSLIAEGAPSLMKLAYAMDKREGEKHVEYDHGYFGWIKFEADTDAAKALTAALNAHPSILRSMVFKTLREDTRAKFKAPTLREVKRTDTIKSSMRKGEAQPEPALSEAELEKALETLTQE